MFTPHIPVRGAGHALRGVRLARLSVQSVYALFESFADRSKGLRGWIGRAHPYVAGCDGVLNLVAQATIWPPRHAPDQLAVQYSVAITEGISCLGEPCSAVSSRACDSGHELRMVNPSAIHDEAGGAAAGVALLTARRISYATSSSFIASQLAGIGLRLGAHAALPTPR